MPKIAYRDWKPNARSAELVTTAEQICRSYAAQGYNLTLRQLYYQFVARDIIPNTMQSYKALGETVGNARLAGLLDWNYLVDRTRNLDAVAHWDSPSDIIDVAARGYTIDHWTDQPTRVEVWVEKEAMAEIVGRAAHGWDCAYFCCRGYVSLSEMWSAAQRLQSYMISGQDVVILHLGDHDPSGIDMTRDIRDRLTEFGGYRAATMLDVRRIALNMDQIEQYEPPPNPAKLTDSRANGYVELYGYDSWELDALEPQVLDQLIRDAVTGIVDQEDYDARDARQEAERDQLTAVSEQWAEVVEQFA